MSIPIGSRAEASLIVGDIHSAIRQGSGNVPALATPAMIALMEKASLYAIKPFLEEGQDSVGTMVNVKHLAATPLGRRITASARVKAIEGRKILFDVEARCGSNVIGSGEHERILIDREKFIWNMAVSAT